MATRTVLAMSATALALGFAWQASAHGLEGVVGAEDFYTGLKTPTGSSCCNGKDCSPAQWKPDGGPAGSVLLDGEWVPVPLDRIIDTASPDGRAHVCVGHFWNAQGASLFIRCVVLGAGA